jgi:serine/threonine protein phosphatase PrpC
MWATAKVLEAWAPRLEDRAEVFVRGDEAVVVVADGAGGRPGAAYTAETAVRMVGEFVTGRAPGWDPPVWCQLLRRIDEALADDPAAGETTAVVAVLSPHGILGASVGDSGAWLIAPDGMRDLTAQQQRKPFLGTGAAVPVPFAAPWTDGATFLAASDGLFRYTDRAAICAEARGADLEEAARRVVDLARLHSGNAG